MKSDTSKVRIPDKIVGKQGTLAIVYVGGKKIVVTPYTPITLRPTYSNKDINESSSLMASFVQGNIIAYKDGMVLPTNPNAGIAVPVLKDKADVVSVSEVSIVRGKDGRVSTHVSVPSGVTEKAAALVEAAKSAKKRDREEVYNDTLGDSDITTPKKHFSDYKLDGFEGAKRFSEKVAGGK
jgi:hypothetical protein